MEFVIGQTVRLKSNPQLMTIYQIKTIGFMTVIICHWMDAGGHLHGGQFMPSMLEGA